MNEGGRDRGREGGEADDIWFQVVPSLPPSLPPTLLTSHLGIWLSLTK